MAEAVQRWIIMTEPTIQARVTVVIYDLFVMEKVALSHAYLRVSSFSPAITIPSLLHTHFSAFP